MDVKLKQLLEWIGTWSQFESALLWPNPQAYVFLMPLVDEIVRLYSLDKDEAVKIVNEAGVAADRRRSQP